MSQRSKRLRRRSVDAGASDKQRSSAKNLMDIQVDENYKDVESDSDDLNLVSLDYKDDRPPTPVKKKTNKTKFNRKAEGKGSKSIKQAPTN